MIDGVNRIPRCYTPIPIGAFYTVAKLPVDDAEKFCEWCLSDFIWKDDYTPEGCIGETVMMAPAAGFYTTPGSVVDQVRLLMCSVRRIFREPCLCLTEHWRRILGYDSHRMIEIIISTI